MNRLQKAGGLAAILMALMWLVGMAVFLGVLTPAGYYDPDLDAVQKAEIVVDNHTTVSLSYLTAFVSWGFLQIVLSLALYQRVKAAAPGMAQAATAVGVIWAGLVIASGMVANVGLAAVAELYAADPSQAGALWLAVETVHLGLGGGNEIVGGLWLLLIGWSALRAQELSRPVNYLGAVAGVAGILTVIPLLEVLGAVEAMGMVFGLGGIVWFIWVGFVMLRTSRGAAPPVARSGSLSEPEARP